MEAFDSILWHRLVCQKSRHGISIMCALCRHRYQIRRYKSPLTAAVFVGLDRVFRRTTILPGRRPLMNGDIRHQQQKAPHINKSWLPVPSVCGNDLRVCPKT